MFAGGTELDLGPPHQRLVLSALALDAGQAVPLETLVDRLWGTSPPHRPRDSVYAHIARLRSAIAAGTEPADRSILRRRSGGYVLELEPLRVDAHRLDDLLTRARERRCPDARRAELLRQALALWRGDPLADLSGLWVDHVREILRLKRLHAMELWARSELRLGDPGCVIDELTAAVQANPYVETLTGLLMQALAGAGRTAEALDYFVRLRERLAEELGADPCAELQRVHRDILRGEWRHPLLDAAPPAAPPPPVPAQLPMDVYGFTGRTAELRHLDEIRDRGTRRLIVITGTAGVGKTALAVRWAHASADRFPDGQLYVNLRGFEPASAPLPAIEALGRLLRALGIDSRSVPRDLDEASALYRSLLAGKCVLVVLDNVHSAEQIRPLLPGTASCLVLATSRHRLGGLMARDGARFITMGPLSPAQAQALLAEMLGADRVAADPHAAELARRCAYLPLALRIAGANLATRPHLTVSGYIEQMDRQGPLEALHVDDDEHAAVTVAFDVSYGQLTPAARRLFRLSSLLAGHDFDVFTAAALCGLTREAATAALDELYAAHLVHRDGDGRFSTHDLLRAYRTRKLRCDEPDPGTAEASRRLVDFYTETTYEAAPLFMPRRNKKSPDIVHVPPDRLRFPHRGAAAHWHDAERDNLLGAVELAARHGWHQPAWQLAETLFSYFSISRQWTVWLAITSIGLACAESTGDHEAIARLNICRGTVYKQMGDLVRARASWTTALHEATLIDHHRLRSACQVNLGGLCVLDGDLPAAVAHLESALAHTEYSGDPEYGAPLRINYGCALLDMGDMERAADAFTEALIMAEDAGDPLHVCFARHNLGEIALRRHDTATALRHARRQLRTAEEIGDPLRQALSLDLLASATCHEDLELARRLWQRAHALLHALDHRLAEHTARWLRATETMSPEAVRAADEPRRRQARTMI